ncbi:ABC transporter permease [Rubeoparvulum massiliense]|uniref:ABC transporter permease n=1 Tax=Rubeoparvulum massiliense TaxID=1631346 RepID=UPI00065E4E62|nr:ABC transporter permease [Rubeoparvulum massiliense]
MLNLMRLELYKLKLPSLIKGVLIANVVISAFLLLILYGPQPDEDVAFKNYTELFVAIDTFVRAAFIIYAAALIAKLIIDEYKNRTITVLFLYPISRKKLMVAKLLIIALFTFLAILLSYAVLMTSFYALSINQQLIADTLTISMITDQTIKLVMNAISATGMSLIPLYFGMRKFSVPTTILSSIIIVMIACSNNAGFTLNDILFIPISLAALGTYIAYASIHRIEERDIH